MKNKLVCGIDIEITRKNIRHIYLSVHPPNGRVRLSIPGKMDEEDIRLFIKSKEDWIKKQQLRFRVEEVEEESQFISGESHCLWGVKYRLNVFETSGKEYVELGNKSEIDLYARAGSKKEKREILINEWYRTQLKGIIPGYIKKWERVMDLEVEDWGVKKMKTRWGSCNIQAKRIWINLELAKKSPRCLDYIIVHEMLHLIERKHNDRFKAYMDSFLPDWKVIKAELNGLKYEVNN